MFEVYKELGCPLGGLGNGITRFTNDTKTNQSKLFVFFVVTQSLQIRERLQVVFEEHLMAAMIGLKKSQVNSAWKPHYDQLEDQRNDKLDPSLFCSS